MENSAKDEGQLSKKLGRMSIEDKQEAKLPLPEQIKLLFQTSKSPVNKMKLKS